MNLYQTEDTIFFSDSPITSRKKIPAGNWLIKYCDKKGFYLKKQPDFTLPIKVYGDLETPSKRYMKTFKNKKKNLGICLAGESGAGKTLIAKKLCIDSKLPTLILSTPYSGTTFEDWLTSINQECIVFIDEFEKKYTDKKQNKESLLSLLDGTFTSKKIFIFTVNDVHKLSTYMKNRPGRIHYMETFTGLKDDMIKEIIEDKLKHTHHKEELLEIINLLGTINMDSLISMIEEINLFDEAPKEIIKRLNINFKETLYNVSFKKEGLTYVKSHVEHPLLREFFYIECNSYCDKTQDWLSHEVTYDFEELEVTKSATGLQIKDPDGIVYNYKKRIKKSFIF